MKAVYKSRAGYYYDHVARRAPTLSHPGGRDYRVGERVHGAEIMYIGSEADCLRIVREHTAE